MAILPLILSGMRHVALKSQLNEFEQFTFLIRVAGLTKIKELHLLEFKSGMSKEVDEG